jgi:hypothetical protein
MVLSALCISLATAGSVPLVAELASNWLPNEPERDSPSINSFTCSVGTSKTDIFDVNSFTATPYNSGITIGALRVDGQSVVPSEHQWIAYEANRRGKCNLEGSAMDVTSHVRLAFEGSSLMFEVHFNRSSRAASNGNISTELEMRPLIRGYSAFPWVLPYPNKTSEFHFSTMDVGGTSALLTSDSSSSGQSMAHFGMERRI